MARPMVLMVLAIGLACAPAAQERAAVTQELLGRFMSEEVFWKQFEIAKVLALQPDARTLDALEPLLEHDDRHIRANAAFVFARLGDPRGLATIEGILVDRSERRLGQGIPVVVKNPDDPRSWMPSQIRTDRYYAVHMLGELKDRRGVDILVPLLADADVDYHAAWALGQIGDAGAIAPLIGALDDRDALVRVSAIQALEALNAAEAVPTLRGLLDDTALPIAGDRVPVADVAKAAIRRLTKEP